MADSKSLRRRGSRLVILLYVVNRQGRRMRRRPCKPGHAASSRALRASERGCALVKGDHRIPVGARRSEDPDIQAAGSVSSATAVQPPVTGGKNATSSPARTDAPRCVYSRFTATSTLSGMGCPPVARCHVSPAVPARAASTSTSRQPIDSRRLAKNLTVIVICDPPSNGSGPVLSSPVREWTLPPVLVLWIRAAHGHERDAWRWPRWVAAMLSLPGVSCGR